VIITDTEIILTDDDLVPLPRSPIDLFQHDSSDCVCCVTAQLLYMYDQRGRMPAVAWLDQQFDRHAGECADYRAAQLLLLGRGFGLHVISSFDEAAYERERLAYLRRFYEDVWSDDHEATFTDRYVHNQLRQIRYQVPQFDASPLYRRERSIPTLDDVYRQLRYGPVMVGIHGKTSTTNHLVLLTDQTADGVRLYYPRQHPRDLPAGYAIAPGFTLPTYTEAAFLKVWRPREGLIGVCR
jgi:hypothetical protein